MGAFPAKEYTDTTLDGYPVKAKKLKDGVYRISSGGRPFVNIYKAEKPDGFFYEYDMIDLPCRVVDGGGLTLVPGRVGKWTYTEESSFSIKNFLFLFDGERTNHMLVTNCKKKGDDAMWDAFQFPEKCGAFSRIRHDPTKNLNNDYFKGKHMFVDQVENIQLRVMHYKRSGQRTILYLCVGDRVTKYAHDDDVSLMYCLKKFVFPFTVDVCGGSFRWTPKSTIGILSSLLEVPRGTGTLDEYPATFSDDGTLLTYQTPSYTVHVAEEKGLWVEPKSSSLWSWRPTDPEYTPTIDRHPIRGAGVRTYKNGIVETGLFKFGSFVGGTVKVPYVEDTERRYNKSPELPDNHPILLGGIMSIGEDVNCLLYIGTCDKAYLRSGFGEMVTTDIKYKGHWAKDEFHGDGLLVTKQLSMSGNFTRGKANGVMTCVRLGRDGASKPYREHYDMGVPQSQHPWCVGTQVPASAPQEGEPDRYDEEGETA